MSRRTDPMHYDIEIEEIKTGKVNRSQVGAWWTGEHSLRSLHAMCDCQLGGYFHAKSFKVREADGQERISWSNSFSNGQADYLKANTCKHGPARKFRPLRAILPSGETIDLKVKVAA